MLKKFELLPINLQLFADSEDISTDTGATEDVADPQTETEGNDNTDGDSTDTGASDSDSGTASQKPKQSPEVDSIWRICWEIGFQTGIPYI